MIKFLSLILLHVALSFKIAQSDEGKKIKIVSSIPPIHSLVTMVTGDLAENHLIIKYNDDPHHYHLRPLDAKHLAEADLIFMIDENFEDYLHGKINHLGKTKLVTFANQTGMNLLKVRNSNLWLDDHDHHEHHDHSKCHHSDHLHDFHIWLSVKNAIKMVEIIEKQLRSLDPKNSEIYKSNAKKALLKLSELHSEILQVTEKIGKSKKYIVFHDAYQYFEHEFNLPASSSILDKNANEKNIKSLSELAKFIEEQQVKCIFYERQFSRSNIEFLTKSSSVEKTLLDPLWGRDHNGNLVTGDQSYFALIKNIADGLHSCLEK